MLSNIVLSAYSYVIYLLCFPECKWSVKRKMEKVREVRKKLEIDQYISYALTTDLGLGDRIKQKLICLGQEKMLILIGPIFMKVVRKANG